MEEFGFSIGNLNITVAQENGCRKLSFDPAMTHFSSAKIDKPDIYYEISSKTFFPSNDAYAVKFQTKPEGIWTIFQNRTEKSYLIRLENIDSGPPFLVALADEKFSKFEIYPGDRETFGFWYPFDEMTIAAHANINRIGIILHAACVAVNGKGYLFAGTSGAGKSTIANIWLSHPDAIVVTDERVLIRRQEGRLWAYGTPWHGTAEIHKNVGVPLEEVFFIKHGAQNQASEVQTVDAANRLLVRCFPTFWHKEGMQFVLDLCYEIARSIHCQQLAFAPSDDVTNYILNKI
jgi:hypothetical protein